MSGDEVPLVAARAGSAAQTGKLTAPGTATGRIRAAGRSCDTSPSRPRSRNPRYYCYCLGLVFSVGRLRAASNGEEGGNWVGGNRRHVNSSGAWEQRAFTPYASTREELIP